MATAIDTTDNENLISHDEVERWSVEALKDYCRKRGYKVTGAKKDLVSTVFFLYNNRIEEQPGAKQQEASRKKDYRTLVNLKHSAPDPHVLKRWTDEKTGIKLWPPISIVDIHWFLQCNGSTGLTTDALTAYKQGKAFGYFSCDWLKEIYYTPINKTHACCFLKADCTPSNRINDLPHKLWVKVIKSSGEIVSAYCSCMAGLSQTCNHVAALLFKVNAAFKLELSNPACTSTASVWTAPSGAKHPVNMKLREMSFVKPRYSKGKRDLPNTCHNVRESRTRETLLEESDPQLYRQFIADMKETLPNASLFLPGPPAAVDSDDDSDIICLEDESNDSQRLLSTLGMAEVATISLSTEDLIAKLNAAPESDLDLIEKLTQDQGNTPLWMQMRRGRITASNFYRVFTKIETMKRKASATCDSLLESLLNPKPLDHLTQIQQGRRLEKPALNKLSTLLTAEGHSNVEIKPTGLFIDKTNRYLGASPDGLVSCDCCVDRLIEVKCPTTPLDSLKYLDDGLTLKQNQLYFAQIQGQLMIAGLKESWFYIFYEHHECHLQMIKFDEKYCRELTGNLEKFFKLYMSSRLLLGRKRKLPV